MSTLQVKMQQIDRVCSHPNADRLEIVYIKGWQSIVSKGKFKSCDTVCFIPPDFILPEKLHTYLGVTNYCVELPVGYFRSNEKPTERRVKATRIRGESSYGIVVKLDKIKDYMKYIRNDGYDIPNFDKIVKSNVDWGETLEIKKWNPPIKSTQGDVEKELVGFHKYTDIEHYRNYLDIIKDGESVRVTCKIHGTNCGLGYIRHPASDNFIFCARSHNNNRKKYDNNGNISLYWQPYEKYPQIKEMLDDISVYYIHANVIVFCEIYGSKVQFMDYGVPQGQIDCSVFDISVNGTYLNWERIKYFCDKYNIPMVPLVYSGPFSSEIIERYTNGPSIPPQSKNCKFQGREGIVITPLKERTCLEIGRVILKSVSVDYLNKD